MVSKSQKNNFAAISKPSQLGPNSSNQNHSSISMDSAAFLEAQNDIKLNDLSKKVSLLRGITNDIYNDVNTQNDFLEESVCSYILQV
ncbi:hypothetical protein BB561_002041 [Smittium simulii]|uniref:Uncharacterized protein n=1 Tax=Smittium simulii TaxID=133385 RepID=A0A2T9YRU9_9FUNG|nr:hypothetical protein BB561_002041 [Smittium simulii]